MYQYLVHLERTNVNEYVRRAGAGERFVGYYGQQPEKYDIRNLGLMTGTEGLVETWYFHDEAQAVGFAKCIAQQHPNRSVYVCNVTQVATASMPKVSMAKMSEQGMVPL